jgi:SMC interacting uncharacterized protein involved in chromosome segregation
MLAANNLLKSGIIGELNKMQHYTHSINAALDSPDRHRLHDPIQELFTSIESHNARLVHGVEKRTNNWSQLQSAKVKLSIKSHNEKLWQLERLTALLYKLDKSYKELHTIAIQYPNLTDAIKAEQKQIDGILAELDENAALFDSYALLTQHVNWTALSISTEVKALNKNKKIIKNSIIHLEDLPGSKDQNAKRRELLKNAEYLHHKIESLRSTAFSSLSNAECSLKPLIKKWNCTIIRTKTFANH